MSTTTTQTTPTADDNRRLAAVTGAGLVAGVLFGLLAQFGLERMGTIGAMYTLGDPSLSVGWVAHLVHSALFAAVFGVVADEAVDAARLRDPPTAVVLGLGYGTALWAVNVVVLWPLWLGAVGLGGAPPFPNVALGPLVGHLLYGGVLGGLVAAIYRG